MAGLLRALLIFVLVLSSAGGPVFAAEAQSGRFLQQVVGSSAKHEKNLQALLRGARSLPSWVRNMISNPRYVSGASRAVTVDGKPAELFGACLAGKCGQSRLRVLFSPEGDALSLRVEDAQLGEVLLGAPSEAALSQLRLPGI
jgi:Inhibitor of vertebrate lysozyme (Ivy)